MNTNLSLMVRITVNIQYGTENIYEDTKAGIQCYSSSWVVPVRSLCFKRTQPFLNELE